MGRVTPAESLLSTWRAVCWRMLGKMLTSAAEGNDGLLYEALEYSAAANGRDSPPNHLPFTDDHVKSRDHGAHATMPQSGGACVIAAA